MNDLKESRIIITGGAGFVGSTIVDQLLDEGVRQIIIVDNLVRGSENNIRNALKSGKVTFVNGDIRNTDLLDDLFSDTDYCFHMAALRITQCAAEPREAFEVMYDGTFNVAEACVKHKIKKIVAASSASIYGQANMFPTKETHHPYNNMTLYGAAKAANELMFSSFYHMYGLKHMMLRYFNIYGPRMDIHGKYTEVLIKWYHLLKARKEPLIYGDGKQTMDFVFVEDIARASILALKSEGHNEVFNIAGGAETSLEELCRLLIDVMDVKLEPRYVPISNDRKKVEVLRRLADTTKANDQIGFKAKVLLRDGLEKLVLWLDAQEKNKVGIT